MCTAAAMTTTEKAKHFRYESAAFFLIKPIWPLLMPLVRLVFHLRWKMSQPCVVRVLPKCLPVLPGPLKALAYMTNGELILAVPLALLVIAGYNQSFINPDVDWSGHISAIAIIFAFLTAGKSNSPFAFFLGIPFERLIPYHNLSSLVAIVTGAFHTYVSFVYRKEEDEEGGSADGRRRLSADDSIYASFGTHPDLIKFLFDGWVNLSGTIILLCMIGLVSTSFFSIIRRWFFEYWLFTHILCTVGVIAFSAVHGAITVLFAAGWWGVDLVFRYVIMAMYIYPKKATVKLVLPDVVEVRFPKPEGFRYNAGQFVQVNFPGLAALQFHPITISSAPHESEVTLHIRALGHWSRKLVELASKSTKGVETDILVEGPYGSLSIELENDDKYQMVLMVSGGIGVTPCQSVARSILHQYCYEDRKLQKLQFVWAVRKLDMAFGIPPPSQQSQQVEIGGEGNTFFTMIPVDDDDLNLLSTKVYVTRADNDEESTNLDGIHAPFQILKGRPNFDSMVEGSERRSPKPKARTCGGDWVWTIVHDGPIESCLSAV